MGFDFGDILDPFDLVDTGGSLAPSNLLGLNAPGEASAAQTAAGERALEFGAEQVAPFRDLGIEGANLLSPFLAGEQPSFGGFDTDPNRVLNNPLFQALAGDQEQRLINQRAALGLGGSGGTRRDLNKNLLLLGNQFQQQDIGNQQQTFQNRLSANQNRFNQLFDVSRLGANAATQQATSGAGIIQGIGNAQSAGIIGKQNAISGLLQQAGGAGSGAVLGSAGALGGGIGAGGGALLGLFSDVRLKDNIEYVETIHGVNMYQWDWTVPALSIVGDQPEYGPLAQELRETHPHLVGESPEGYLMISDGGQTTWH